MATRFRAPSVQATLSLALGVVTRGWGRELPPVLAIPLKPFEYDYERLFRQVQRLFRISPRPEYVAVHSMGFSRADGEIIDYDMEEFNRDVCTRYQLTVIVVHSGQASGGHY